MAGLIVSGRMGSANNKPRIMGVDVGTACRHLPTVQILLYLRWRRPSTIDRELNLTIAIYLWQTTNVAALRPTGSISLVLACASIDTRRMSMGRNIDSKEKASITHSSHHKRYHIRARQLKSPFPQGDLLEPLRFEPLDARSWNLGQFMGMGWERGLKFYFRFGPTSLPLSRSGSGPRSSAWAVPNFPQIESARASIRLIVTGAKTLEGWGDGVRPRRSGTNLRTLGTRRQRESGGGERGGRNYTALISRRAVPGAALIRTCNMQIFTVSRRTSPSRGSTKTSGKCKIRNGLLKCQIEADDEVSPKISQPS
ncbi:hypothetical protein V8F20_005233 [Naviculisporaceae sp. PSN 640]